MPTRDDAVQAVLEEFERVRKANVTQLGVKAMIYLRLAEAYAWLISPSQPHGSSASSDS